MWARAAGYDFLQILPLRGVSGMDDWHLSVRYVEGAWNPVHSLWQALRHQNGAEDMPSNWRDWLAFPTPEKCAVSTTTMLILHGHCFIAHSFDNNKIVELIGKERILIELCPELEMSPEVIAEKCRQEGWGLVLDAEHLARPWRDFDPRKNQPHPFLDFEGGIFETIGMLAPYIRVVHVKWLTDDEREDVDKEIIRWLLGCDHRDEIDFVAEFTPILGPPAKVKRHMSRFLEKMREVVEGGR